MLEGHDKGVKRDRDTPQSFYWKIMDKKCYTHN